MITIIDALGYIRRAFETDQGGRAPRRLFSEQLARGAGPVIWVFDHPTCRTPRRALYPDYKANRQAPADDFYPMVKLIRDALSHTTAIQVEVPNFEADDVIASFVVAYSGSQIRIETVDRDLTQLAVFPNVRLSIDAKEDPRWVRLKKAVVGDPSDNIPGIPGFGEGAWKATDREKLEAYLVHGVGELPLIPKRCANWLDEPDNLARIRMFYQIVGFLDVPYEEIQKAMTVGTNTPEKGEELLREFMH